MKKRTAMRRRTRSEDVRVVPLEEEPVNAAELRGIEAGERDFREGRFTMIEEYVARRYFAPSRKAARPRPTTR